jgi:glycosyltransferase involved in cell wall biosynthesis
VYQPHAWSFLAAHGLLRPATVHWERRAARWTDALICVSAAERAAGERLGITARTWTVPNGVDGARLRPVDQRTARADLGCPDVPTAVCVGRLCEQKGQASLLAVWPAVRHTVPGARLVLVGDGPDRPALEAAAARTPGVELVGAQPDPDRWYAAADVVVAPSLWEGMALAPLEAMACGRSVVVTDVAGAVESVPADAGAVVPIGDAAALAGAVVLRLTDASRATAEGIAGRRHVRYRHDLDAAAGAVAQIYLDVLCPSIDDRAATHRR